MGSDETPVGAGDSASKAPVDPAALGAAVLAAVVAMTLQPGRYGWFGLGIGVVLALLLATYYRAHETPFRSYPELFLRSATFGGVGGLVAAMIASWPIQGFVDKNGMVAAECRRVPVDKVDACAGEVASGGWAGPGSE